MSELQMMAGSPGKSWRLFESSDVDETREKISRVLQPHRLAPLNRGKHQGSMNYVSLGSIGIGTIRFGEMAIDLDEVEGYHLFIFCLSGKAELNIHRETMDASGTQGVYVAPGTPLRGRFSHDCEQLVLRVDKRALTAANEGNLPHFRTRIDMKAPLSSPWASILNSLIGDDGSVAKIVKLEHAWRRLDGRNDDGFQVAPFPG